MADASSLCVLLIAEDAASAPELATALGVPADVVKHGVSLDAVAVALRTGRIDFVVVDLGCAAPSPATAIAALRAELGTIPLVAAGADQSAADAIMALRAGANEFLVRPFARDDARFVLDKCLARLERRSALPEDAQVPGSRALLGDSPPMRQVLETVAKAAAGSATVLLRGESGTGKEMIARRLHEQSPRASEPFVKIDCASLPENLLESELFGYEKGAFTGASTRKAGRVEFAEGGTLFLDEIGELGLPLQAKLLRLLQDREIERLGATRTTRVDVRVVAATHRDLETMIEERQFRQDLFYRLNVIPIWLPPLRARRGDIDLLARHFCESFALANGRADVRLEDGALKLLRGQRWPGNVRQLQNFLERLAVLSEAPAIGAEQVRAELDRQVRFVTDPATLGTSTAAPAGGAPTEPAAGLDASVRHAERLALARALERSGNNRTLAARLLGVSRSQLYRKLEEHGLD